MQLIDLKDIPITSTTNDRKVQLISQLINVLAVEDVKNGTITTDGTASGEQIKQLISQIKDLIKQTMTIALSEQLNKLIDQLITQLTSGNSSASTNSSKFKLL